MAHEGQSMSRDHWCADRLEIAELVHRYCDALCERDKAAWVGTWAPDGEWNIGRGPVVGHVELEIQPANRYLALSW